uniref:Uncharacterized protein n=1 Tax=Hyaloperonospora arabidopsidis (strain Emoy2) TaxID=559515 RepID=M4BEH9_HYAAE
MVVSRSTEFPRRSAANYTDFVDHQKGLKFHRNLLMVPQINPPCIFSGNLREVDSPDWGSQRLSAKKSELAKISREMPQFHVGRKNGKTITPQAENHLYPQKKNQHDRCPPIAPATEIEFQRDQETPIESVRIGYDRRVLTPVHQTWKRQEPSFLLRWGRLPGRRRFEPGGNRERSFLSRRGNFLGSFGGRMESPCRDAGNTSARRVKRESFEWGS